MHKTVIASLNGNPGPLKDLLNPKHCKDCNTSSTKDYWTNISTEIAESAESSFKSGVEGMSG